MPVVAPFHQRRQRHQDGLGAAARLQTEQRAAVIDQVEFDVATAAVSLEIALACGVGNVPAPRDDRQIGVEKAVADAPGQREAALEASLADLVQIVEENPTDAARLVPVFQEKVAVAPVLVARVELGPVWI